ncbi:MAG: class I SAM-dependent methyltransferase [Gammaproteobacteria bacterium]|nr:class I SAM-dependent methyltransferase [Gammaproteobacteria bacterium]
MNSEYSKKETARLRAFKTIWANDIDNVFSDVASYYDRVNIFASLGLLNRIRQQFISTIDIQPSHKVLDVCAGTNIIGIELLKKQPDLDIYAVDRSVAMQEVGKTRASQHGFKINGFICDVHTLPFPDNYFDVVTLQYATRHLRVIDVFSEISRVLKPGGHFYHCDMLRPANKIIERSYYLFLKTSLALLSRAFRSGTAAINCQDYFIDAIRLFYSTEELSRILSELGFADVIGNSVLGGTVAFHKACKV